MPRTSISPAATSSAVAVTQETASTKARPMLGRPVSFLLGRRFSVDCCLSRVSSGLRVSFFTSWGGCLGVSAEGSEKGSGGIDRDGCLGICIVSVAQRSLNRLTLRTLSHVSIPSVQTRFSGRMVPRRIPSRTWFLSIGPNF